ncbi:MAG: glycosyltransferase family 4 protein [Acidobacteria bacterium]|nr:glycosyltransferase family 4 protein [Acidobacteriota bacterium]
MVGQNRRLAHEMAVAGAGRWDVTAAAPAALHGDLRHIVLEPIAGEQCRVVPLRVRLDRQPHLMWYRGLRPLLRERWDVVHCWQEPYVAAGAQVASAVAAEAQFVFATFQNIAKRYPPPFNWMERRVLTRADGWIAFGHTVHATHAGRRAYARRPSRVIPPGVDVERFAPDAAAGTQIRTRLGWDDTRPVVGFLGRFVPEKGLDVLIAALERLRSPWRALFVGAGPEAARLQAFAAAHSSAVRLVTDAAHEDVPAYLNAMTVLCAPSRTTGRWREQFGRMLIEAMAAGVPVLASRSGEIPYVVEGAGALLPEDDPAAWANALDTLLRDAAARAAASVRGRDRARAHFAWPVVARAHLAFFDELLDRRGVGR